MLSEGILTRFSRAAAKAAPTHNKAFVLALAGALASAAAVVTVWMVLLRKRGDDWEDDGSWNPDEAYNMALEEEVVFDGTSSIGAQMASYADQSRPDQRNHKTPTKKNRHSVGSYGSVDGHGATPMKWTRTTPTRRSPGNRNGYSNAEVDAFV